MLYKGINTIKKVEFLPKGIADIEFVMPIIEKKLPELFDSFNN
jgi:hypothetical protein